MFVCGAIAVVELEAVFPRFDAIARPRSGGCRWTFGDRGGGTHRNGVAIEDDAPAPAFGIEWRIDDDFGARQRREQQHPGVTFSGAADAHLPRCRRPPLLCGHYVVNPFADGGKLKEAAAVDL